MIKYLVLSMLFPFALVKYYFFKSKGVRVLILHDVSAHDLRRLEVLIEKLSRSWDFISPSDFISYLDGDIALARRSILISFDDGFRSSYLASKRLDDIFDIKTVHFIPTDFLSCRTDEEVENFLINNLNISCHSVRGLALEPMRLCEVVSLIDRNHWVGSHTCSHPKLSVSQTDLVTRELERSKAALREITGVDVLEFAYPFGDCGSIDPRSFSIARSFFERVYSGCRGINIPNRPSFIYRDAIGLGDPFFFNIIYLSGILDWFYFSRFKGYIDS